MYLSHFQTDCVRCATRAMFFVSVRVKMHFDFNENVTLDGENHFTACCVTWTVIIISLPIASQRPLNVNNSVS